MNDLNKSKITLCKIEIFASAANHICVLLIQTLENGAPIGIYCKIEIFHYNGFLKMFLYVVYFWRALELGPRSTGEEYTKAIVDAMNEDKLFPLMKKK